MTFAWMPVLLAIAGVVVARPQGQPASGDQANRGLDHIPIAVADLERAAERYRALGFALKPGRPHENGIRNEHAKFTDGTELELITAPAARDELTSTYRSTSLPATALPSWLSTCRRLVKPIASPRRRMSSSAG
jgi:hypothetical protein